MTDSAHKTDGEAGIELRAGYRVQDLDWFDSARDRAVPVKLFWPDAARARTVPLVVFSHGIGGSRRGYSYLGRHWAAQGYASLHLQHVGSDRSLWGGNPFALVVQDADGQAALDWGIYGAPETFVVDAEGIVRFKHIGPLTPEIVQDKIRPLLEAAP